MTACQSRGFFIQKITPQLDQLPKECKYLSDLLIPNPKSRSGYSQIDQLVVSPYGLFVIETKNYNGEIKGGRKDEYWTVSNRYKMYNPIRQNYGHIKALESHLGEHKPAKYFSMISFTMRCRFSIDPELRKIGSDELSINMRTPKSDRSIFKKPKITEVEYEQSSTGTRRTGAAGVAGTVKRNASGEAAERCGPWE
ncbi:nuclease-related domain-containing protein [Paenibacillus sophorae]|uniref:nuclease-related domain-containing protein n=1 Tax=Paenibacillus sophorae TaxID=1333845 RepID=UPI00248473C4|nr:nuclease-related domain-containing protein [Paenibacillus sophorae]